MVLETEPRLYADWQQFELLKKKKRLGQLPTTQLSAPLWLNNRQARELGYDVPEGEDFLLEPTAPEGKAVYGRIPQPTITAMPTGKVPIPTIPTAIPEVTLGGDFGKLYQEYQRTGGTLDVLQWGASGAPLRPEMGEIPSEEGLGRFLEQLADAGQINDVETILRQVGFGEEQIDEVVGIEERQRELEDLVTKTFPQLDLPGFADLVATDPDAFIKQIRTGGWTKDKENLLRLMGISDEEIGKVIAPWWTLDYWKYQFFKPYGGKDIKGKLAASDR